MPIPHRESCRRLGAVAGLVAATCVALPAQSIAIPDDYARAHQGERRYEVAAGVELAMILTAVALRDADVKLHPIRRDADYHGEVIAHFGRHADHPVFAALGLAPDDGGARYDGEPFRRFRDLRNSAYRWRLVDGALEKFEFLGNWWLGEEFADPFDTHIDLIRDFARVSDFAAFFAAHAPYYDRLSALYDERVDLSELVDWLSANFSSRYSSYRILFSPLMRGNQSTTRKRDDDSDFVQVFMIVDPPIESATAASALHAFRWIFTELDHQYVDPAAERHIERIDAIFANRELWTAGQESANYRTPFRVFCEYLTWSLYAVYLRERYPAEDHEPVCRDLTKWFESRRGFPRFGEMTDELTRLRREGDDRIEDLMPRLLDWAEARNRR